MTRINCRREFTLGIVGHFGLAVRNPKKSAEWFLVVLGLRKEFEFENGIGNQNVTIVLFKGEPSPQTLKHMLSVWLRDQPVLFCWGKSSLGEIGRIFERFLHFLGQALHPGNPLSRLASEVLVLNDARISPALRQELAR